MGTAVALHAAGIVEVVGESYRQDVLQQVAAQATTAEAFLDELSGYARERAEDAPEGRWFRAELVREPSNPADPRAVAVHAAGVGQIGYSVATWRARTRRSSLRSRLSAAASVRVLHS